jgi:predicted secreted protein
MKKLFLLLIIVMLALTACNGKSTEAPATDELVISEPGKSIEVITGNEFKIIIESNASTGYHWELVGNLDENVVQFVVREYRADEPVMPGSGGRDVWVFKAIAAGETTITLGSYPPGEGQPVSQEVTFTIIVK